MTPETDCNPGCRCCLAGLVLNGQRQINARLDRLDAGYSDLRERMARLEGLFEGFSRSEPSTAA